MAVRIVGHGEQDVRRVTCERCHAVLEFAKSDVLVEPQYDDAGEYAGERRWIDCPKCNSQVEIAT
jgi:hypothetical protein